MLSCKQVYLLWIGVVLTVAMAIFPPWEHRPYVRYAVTAPAGYHAIFAPPPLENVHIDVTRLAIQWIALLVVVGAAILTSGRGPKPPNQSEAAKLRERKDNAQHMFLMGVRALQNRIAQLWSDWNSERLPKVLQFSLTVVFVTVILVVVRLGAYGRDWFERHFVIVPHDGTAAQYISASHRRRVRFLVDICDGGRCITPREQACGFDLPVDGQDLVVNCFLDAVDSVPPQTPLATIVRGCGRRFREFSGKGEDWELSFCARNGGTWGVADAQ
jgi:hypothetical protein